MNNKETLKCFDIMSAFIDGKIVQCKWRTDVEWRELSTIDPVWNWTDFEYRIKAEPSYRPWRTVDEVPVGAIIRDKRSSNLRTMIGGVWTRKNGESTVVKLMAGHTDPVTTPWLLENYTLDDGSPCGIKIE